MNWLPFVLGLGAGLVLAAPLFFVALALCQAAGVGDDER